MTTAPQDHRRATGILAAAYHLPGERIDIVPWAADEKVDPRLVESLLANGCRYFHAMAEASDADFIGTALDRLDLPGDWVRGVRYLVHAHTQAFSMPAPPSSILSDLVARYGFDCSLAFSVSHLGCASVISAVACAARLLDSDPNAEYALVVTSDRVFGDARFRIQGRTTIQSDGASAIVLGRERLRCRLGTANFKHFARLHDGPSTPPNAMRMARVLWRHAAELMREHEAATGVKLAELGQILPTNSDQADWVRVTEALQLPKGLIYLDNIAARGHACCADFAVNLVDRGFEQAGLGRMQVACGLSNVGAFSAVTLLPPQPTEH